MDNSHHEPPGLPKRSSSKSATSSDSPGVGQTPTPPPLPVASSASQLKAKYIIVGSAIGFMTTIGVVLALREPVDHSNSGNGNGTAGIAGKLSGDGQTQKHDTQQELPSIQKSQAKERNDESKNKKQSQPKVRNDESKKPPQKSARPQNAALADIRDNHDGLLKLPERSFSLGGVRGFTKLAKIFVGASHDCQLEILGSRIVLSEVESFKLEPNPKSERPRVWKVLKKTQNLNAKTLIGTFKLDNDSFTFEWNKRAPVTAHPERLKYCLLSVQVGNDREVCRMSDAVQVPLVKLDLEKRVTIADVLVEIGSIPDFSQLRLDLQVDGLPLDGFPRFEVLPSNGMKLGDTTTFQVFARGEAINKRFAKVEVTFEESDSQCQIDLRVFGFAEKINRKPPYNKQRGEWKFLNRADLKEGEEECVKQISGLKKDIDKDIGKISGLETGIEKMIGPIRDIEQKRPRSPGNNASDDKKISYRAKLRLYVSQYGDRLEKLKREKELREDEKHKLTKENETRAKIQQLLEENKKWCEDMLDLFDKLEEKVSISYQLYIDVEGHKVVIVRTGSLTSRG